MIRVSGFAARTVAVVSDNCPHIEREVRRTDPPRGLRRLRIGSWYHGTVPFDARVGKRLSVSGESPPKFRRATKKAAIWGLLRSKVLIDYAVPYIVAGGTWQGLSVHILRISWSIAP